jgi:transcriptional regulator with XRE-family HTH domain
MKATPRAFTQRKNTQRAYTFNEIAKRICSVHILSMGTKELKELMTELAKACQPYGRQKEVAKELGVSEQILSNWLSGSRVPLLKNLFKIEAFLKKLKSKPKGRKSTR